MKHDKIDGSVYYELLKLVQTTNSDLWWKLEGPELYSIIATPNLEKSTLSTYGRTKSTANLEIHTKLKNTVFLHLYEPVEFQKQTYRKHYVSFDVYVI